MIMIREGVSYGSKSFAHQVLVAIIEPLTTYFGANSEVVHDFINEEAFFGFVALIDLSSEDFNFIVDEITKANLEDKPKTELITLLQNDPRFEALHA